MSQTDRTGVALTDVDDDFHPHDQNPWYLETFWFSYHVPELADPYLAHRGRQLATLARCLERAQALGPNCEAEEQDDLAALLGRRPASLREGEALLCDRIRSRAAGTERELIEYLSRRSERKAALWAPALGPLYDNPLALPEEL